MNGLTPLIELATQKSLDLFFRAGQGYMACSARQSGQVTTGTGLSPLGVQTRARERIVSTLREVPAASQLYARPGA